MSGTTVEFVETAYYLTVNSTGIVKLIEPFLISSGIGGNGEAWRIIDMAWDQPVWPETFRCRQLDHRGRPHHQQLT
ncbi:hypothetical protein, partial [Bradyrhizobium centrolobii]|uniref:hypothetical protein n=1 Tax=Bradyrhizobium centrolobii TaxID=1505087 RepID=UPI001AECDC90